ncbi:hypothetical protein BT96DRAFT_971875 [Gymnopus androsaceus JB14]|uniref:Uncharacterized protein n=1 Tax=Gymnopus androsaceus JB14 TaxID=1447944 RepID=A0A6A4I7T1_9AGAR|nr:hypothetical protein BT96DRAFT_971875 [Gymnopus androsaceus JB14]
MFAPGPSRRHVQIRIMDASDMFLESMERKSQEPENSLLTAALKAVGLRRDVYVEMIQIGPLLQVVGVLSSHLQVMNFLSYVLILHPQILRPTPTQLGNFDYLLASVISTLGIEHTLSFIMTTVGVMRFNDTQEKEGGGMRGGEKKVEGTALLLEKFKRGLKQNRKHITKKLNNFKSRSRKTSIQYHDRDRSCRLLYDSSVVPPIDDAISPDDHKFFEANRNGQPVWTRDHVCLFDHKQTLYNSPRPSSSLEFQRNTLLSSIKSSCDSSTPAEGRDLHKL